MIQDDLPCQMQLWILEIHQGQSVSSRLLYGWIIPNPFANGTWYKADVETNWAPIPLAKHCILSLNEQTGFDFKGSDCGRLGNLEWIVFPLEEREEIPDYFSTVTQQVECQRDIGIKVREISCREVDVFLNSVPQSPGSLLLMLNGTERLFAYAEWIFHIRVQANWKNGEIHELSVLRRQIFDEMRACWSSDLAIPQKHDVIIRLCGPSAGSWAKDIYKDLMIPLVQDGKLTSDEAILFWIDLLLEKMKGDDKGRISFYHLTDQPLTELCAFIMPSLSLKGWQS